MFEASIIAFPFTNIFFFKDEKPDSNEPLVARNQLRSREQKRTRESLEG